MSAERKPKKRWRDDVRVCECGERYWPKNRMHKDVWDSQKYCSIKCAAIAREERKRKGAA